MKKLLSILLSALMLAAVMTGCTPDNGNTDATTKATEAITESITEVTTESTTTKDAKFSSVHAEFADNTSADLANAQKFTADNSEYETSVVFSATGEITDFAFCSVETIEYTDEGTYKAELKPMHTIDTLNENEPLIVTMTFWGDIPSYGITYTDSTGTNHSELITLSGEDGSVVLMAQ